MEHRLKRIIRMDKNRLFAHAQCNKNEYCRSQNERPGLIVLRRYGVRCGCVIVGVELHGEWIYDNRKLIVKDARKQPLSLLELRLQGPCVRDIE